MEWKCRTPEKDEDIVESLSKDRGFILLSQDISGFRYIEESKIKERSIINLGILRFIIQDIFDINK